MAETSYAKCGDLSLAYQVFGDGPVELVFVGPMVFHVELFWAMPEFKAFFDQLATFCRVLLFDKAGVGLSDPIPKVRLLEERAAEIEAVMDAVGFGKPVVFGMSEGGPQAIAFAARRPERTRALILYGSFAAMPGGSWDDLDRDPAEVRARPCRGRGGNITVVGGSVTVVGGSTTGTPTCGGGGFALDGVSVTVDGGGAGIVTVTGGDGAEVGLRNPASVHAIQARVTIATMNTAVAAAHRIRVGHMSGACSSGCSKARRRLGIVEAAG